MNMKLLLIPFLALLLVAVSGCTDPTGPAVETPDLSVDGVVLETVPEGFEYLGVHNVEADDIRADYVDVEGIVNASEAFYNYDSADYWIVGIEMDSVESAENFIAQYKAGFGPLAMGNRSTEVSFNEHDATVITNYVTAGGDYNVPRYNYVWNNENLVFLVKGNTVNSSVVLDLAKATGF